MGSGAWLPVEVPDTRAPSAPPRYHRTRSCTIAVVSEVDLGSFCRTTGSEASARKSIGGLGVECWLVRTFPTPSRVASPPPGGRPSCPRFAAGLGTTARHRAVGDARTVDSGDRVLRRCAAGVRREQTNWTCSSSSLRSGVGAYRESG